MNYENEIFLSIADFFDKMPGVSSLVGLVILIWLFTAIICLIVIISYAKIFKKAGKPWWASIVPIYNTVVMLEIAELPMWYIALLLLPIVQIYAIFKINIEIAKKFGKSTGFGVGMTLLSVIFIPLLAFSDNIYGVIEESINNTQFDATNIINNQNVNAQLNMNEINAVPVAPIENDNNVNENEINNNIMDNENIMESVVSVSPVENTVQNVESVNVFNAEPSVETISPVENTMQNVEPVNVFNVEPAVESINPIENTVQNVESVNSFNVEPAVEVINPMENTVQNVESVNVFNAEPAVETISPVENTVQNVESLNVFDIEPSVAFNNVQTQANIENNTKKCKNCGNDLPEIVSICPNCGTDNE